MRPAAFILSIGLVTGMAAQAQDSADRTAASNVAPPAASNVSPGVGEKWNFFVTETFTPMTLAAGAFNAGVSQATNSDPRYGVGAGPFAERFGASSADIVTQNFFGDFVMASVFHEDTRYTRQGPLYGGIWKRAGYAISRAFVTNADRGGDTFNWSNVTGTAISVGVSNLYYPPASRKASAVGIHFGTSVVGGGLANLFPEFWPDFRRTLERHHLFPRER